MVSDEGVQLILGLISGSDLPPVFSEPLRWTQLRTLTIGLTLDTRSSFENIIRFLTVFQPSCVENATLHARTFNKDVIYTGQRTYPSKIDADLCLKLHDALLKFRRPQLSFRLSLQGGARKHLWTRELGQRFPQLRDLGRLAIKFESSETLDPSISSI